MANLTLTIDEGVLRRARIRARGSGTSVSAVVRAFLERYAGDEIEVQALAAFAALADGVESGSGPEGRSWTRDSFYDA